MTNTNNWQNYEGFVLAARDAGTAGKKLTLWTKEAGRVFIFAPQARRKANYIGYLVPAAFLRCTVAADIEGYRLLQADGRALTDTWQWTYPMWQVYYFLVHMTEELFASGQADAQVYHLWEQYLTALSRKDLAIRRRFCRKSNFCRFPIQVAKRYLPFYMLRGRMDRNFFLGRD